MGTTTRRKRALSLGYGGTYIDGSGFGADNPGPSAAYNTPFEMDAVFSGNTIATNYNCNDLTGSVAVNTNGNLNTPAGTTGYIGRGPGTDSNEYYDGDVGEILIYNGALSAADRQAVESYLDAKWLGVNGAQVLSASSDVSISSNGILDLNGNNQTINSLTGAGIMTNNGLGPATLTIGGTTSPAAFTGVIADGSTEKTGLTKAGVGLMIMSTTANTYSGPTTIAGGALRIAGDGSLGATAAPVVFSGGTLQAGANNINLNASRTLSVSGGAVGAIDTQGYNMTVSGPINGSGGFEKTGAGVLTLAAGNTYLGATVINNGTLQLGTLSLSLPAVSSGTLERWFDATDINGNGSVVGNGAPVTTWADKSGNTQNAATAGGVVPVYLANAINGLPAVQLGNNSYLSFPTTGLASGNSPFDDVRRRRVDQPGAHLGLDGQLWNQQRAANPRTWTDL